MKFLARGFVVSTVALALLAGCTKSDNKQHISNEDYASLKAQAAKAATADASLSKAQESLAEADKKSEDVQKQIQDVEAKSRSVEEREAAVAPTEARLLEQSQKLTEAQNSVNKASDDLKAAQTELDQRETNVSTSEQDLSKQRDAVKAAQDELARQKSAYDSSLAKVEDLLASKFAPTTLDKVMKGETIATLVGYDVKGVSAPDLAAIRARVAKINTAKKYAKSSRLVSADAKDKDLVDASDSYLVEAKIEDLLALRNDYRNDVRFSLVIVEPVERLNVSRYLVIRDTSNNVVHRFNLAAKVVDGIDFTKVNIEQPSTYAGSEMAEVCHNIDAHCLADLRKTGALDKAFKVTETALGSNVEKTETVRNVLLDYTRDAETKINAVYTANKTSDRVQSLKDSPIYQPTWTEKLKKATDAASNTYAAESAKNVTFMLGMEIGYDVTMFRARAADDYPVDSQYNLKSDDHLKSAPIVQYYDQTLFTLPIRSDNISATPFPADYGTYQDFLSSAEQVLK